MTWTRAWMARPVVAALMAMAPLAAGCSFGAEDRVEVPAAAAGAGGVYVAVGASETVGAGAERPFVDSWPQELYRSAFPRRTTFFNLGVPGATVRQALVEQLPEAQRLRPTVVTVWLNVNDLVDQVPAAGYEADLTTLLTGLRRGGRTRVLVANTPPLERLPAYLNCRADATAGEGCGDADSLPGSAGVVAAVAGYNDAIARVAAGAGAEVVDLDAVVQAARTAGTDATLVGKDGFHPSTAGHKAVADAFAAVLRRPPP